MSSVYKINKGINKPIVFKGIKAQYIAWLGVGVIGLLILFAVLYISGVNMYVCVVVIFMLGVALITGIIYLSDTYGQHGLTKKLAQSSIPSSIRGRSRHLFIGLKIK
jgi:hypothetical protein